ncbi:MAG: response regulator [Capsulimonas sp.]|uniref:response regulator transcription factor n=1 Tax=Capsulimonas sp. TaxID=2494211 RepID=UPI003263CD3C
MKIIIAEDDPVSMRALRTILEGLGHQVTAVPNGVQAWAALQAETFAIVITDWMMPEMDGIELCRNIRARKNVPYTCVILLTAKQTREDRVQGLNAGADVFLTKPLDRSDLIARLQVAERILMLEQGISPVKMRAA